MDVNATNLPTTPPAQVIEEIRAKLAEEPSRQGPAYAMIVGAGFSYGVVPLTQELLHECIGDFYVLDAGGDGHERTRSQKRRYSARFWKEFNEAAPADAQRVALDKTGLPSNPSAAYQNLFDYRVAKELFSPPSDEADRSYVGRLRRARGVPKPKVVGGRKFVNEFLQYVLDPGGYEAQPGRSGARGDYRTTGRNEINGAHFYLASLIELQQTGQLRNLRPFCRTVFTTNFDTLLQDALQLVNVLYTLTDRPERGLDSSDFPDGDPVIHLVYSHGSILRRNAASSVAEIQELKEKSTGALRNYLESRDILILGYGGWDDCLMSALGACGKHRIYWCDVYSPEAAKQSLAPDVLEILTKRDSCATYVCLGSQGAEGFMARLFHALAPAGGPPALLRDPVEPFRERIGRMKLDRSCMPWAGFPRY
ncbi:MAG TPA: SIR2 family protein [Bryobacteraceae bacterium]|nr:SIR2 family protein [Bryobacteraceae bacterium]